jgi:hypothetical protein
MASLLGAPASEVAAVLQAMGYSKDATGRLRWRSPGERRSAQRRGA